MIHHVSLAVENPLQVAKVLAELWNGQIAPFPAHEESYIVAPLDEFGTMIEVYPQGTELLPGMGRQDLIFTYNAFSSLYTGTHIAISVPISQADIEAIAAREGWRVQRCDRGYFEVLEFWVENKLLIELLPPELANQYLSFMQPKNLEQLLLATTGKH